MKRRLRVGHSHVLGYAVVEDSFTKVVRFDVVTTGSGTLPINLIEVVGKEDHAAYDAFPWRSLGDILDVPEEKLEVRMHGGCVVPLCKCEFGSIRTVIDILVVGEGPIIGLRLGFGKVNEVGARRETFIIRTRSYLMSVIFAKRHPEYAYHTMAGRM